METYILEKPMDYDRKYPTVIVCPGGGYTNCSRREAEPIALNFNAAGFNAVIVNYSVYELYPAYLQDISNAIVMVRENAEAWNVDTDKIILIENGSIVEEGSHKELLEAHKFYEKMFNTQASLYKHKNENECKK